MSVLGFPRLHFFGVCSLHQPTGNKNVEGNLDFTKNLVFRNGEKVTPKEDVKAFHAYLRSLGEHSGAGGAPANPFATAAGRDFSGNSRVQWNARVTGCETGFGQRQPDPLLGRRVDLWGHFNEYIGTTFNQPKVVELDSTSAWTRQLYGGQFCLGRTETSVRSGYLVNGNVKGVQSARFHKPRHYVDLAQHWNAEEIGRADLFQLVIEKSDLLVLQNDIESPCLRQLQQLLETDASATGLVVQFTIFNASSPVTPNTPTFCSLVGTLGIWREACEMRSFPAGRVLVPSTGKALQDELGAKLQRSFGCLTLAVCDEGVSLSALMATPFCERSEQPIAGPAHGPGRPAFVEPLFVLERGASTPLARIDPSAWSAENFLNFGGLIDVPFLDGGAAQHLARASTCDLVLARSTQAGFAPVFEERSTVVECESGTVYLDIPSIEEDLYFDETVEVRSFFRGVPARVAGIELASIFNPAVYPYRTPGFDLQAAPGPRIVFKLAGSTVFHEQLSLATDQGGRAELTLRAQRSGSARIVFVTSARERAALELLERSDPFLRYDNDDELGLWGAVGAFNVKVLPDDWSVYRTDIANLDFSFMYEHVLQFYELLYPFMREEVFSLADGAKCRAHSVLNWQMCDPANRDKSFYMPPTRELSFPKAMLFRRFAERSAIQGYVPAGVKR